MHSSSNLSPMPMKTNHLNYYYIFFLTHQCLIERGQGRKQNEGGRNSKIAKGGRERERQTHSKEGKNREKETGGQGERERERRGRGGREILPKTNSLQINCFLVFLFKSPFISNSGK